MLKSQTVAILFYSYARYKTKMKGIYFVPSMATSAGKVLTHSHTHPSMFWFAQQGHVPFGRGLNISY